MPANSRFNIQIYNGLIVAELTGDWSQQDDLLYIAQLSEKITQVKGRTWGILVDMRGWTVQEAATEPNFKITLDRRNQKAECWIVDDMQQGDFLLAQFRHSPVKPEKFLNSTDAIKHLNKLGFTLPQSKFYFDKN